MPSPMNGHRPPSRARRLRLDVLDAVGLLPAARDLYNAARYASSVRVRAANAEFLQRTSPDGLPHPTPRLIYLVSGQFSIQAFHENGALGARCIRRALAACGYEIESFRAVLDFGCGCGRVLRHWSGVSGPRFFGCDYNPLPIEWCRRGLPFAEFSVNPLEGPTVYAEGAFDFVYAISVFSHLDAPRQRTWMGELHRLLLPGGILLVTVLGTAYAGTLDPVERREFEAGRLVVRRGRHAGSNVCYAFHPEAFVRHELARGFDVLGYFPAGAEDAARQDVAVLRKRHAPPPGV